MNELVSVCIPTFNGGDILEKTIKSILISTYSNLEVIVSDDASVDNTKDIVNKMSDKRIIFIENRKRIRTPGNWNKALKKASGKYIGLINHDDEYGPFWINYVVNILEKNPHIGWVISAFRIIDENSMTLRTQLNLGDNQSFEIEDAFKKAITESGFGFGYIARREFIEEIGFYDINAGPYADYDLAIRMATKYPVYYSNNSHHLAWRIHKNNLTNKLTSYDRASYMLKVLDKTFKNKQLPEKLKNQKEYCYSFANQMIINWIDLAIIKKNFIELKKLQSLKIFDEK
jgi:glycosyltransferase involved in cell wall biosynthesis